MTGAEGREALAMRLWMWPGTRARAIRAACPIDELDPVLREELTALAGQARTLNRHCGCI